MWWESEGSLLKAAGPASQKLDQATFSSLKDYAVLELAEEE